MNSKWWLTVLIFVGLFAGLVVGQLLHDPDFKFTMSDSEHAHATAIHIFHFLGDTVFLGLLKMIIIPLIATSVIVGLTSVGDFRELGRIGRADIRQRAGQQRGQRAGIRRAELGSVRQHLRAFPLEHRGRLGHMRLRRRR